MCASADMTRTPRSTQTPSTRPLRSSPGRSSEGAHCDRRPGSRRTRRNASRMPDIATSPIEPPSSIRPAVHQLRALEHDAGPIAVTRVTLRRTTTSKLVKLDLSRLALGAWIPFIRAPLLRANVNERAVSEAISGDDADGADSGRCLFEFPERVGPMKDRRVVARIEAQIACGDFAGSTGERGTGGAMANAENFPARSVECSGRSPVARLLRFRAPKRAIASCATS